MLRTSTMRTHRNEKKCDASKVYVYGLLCFVGIRQVVSCDQRKLLRIIIKSYTFMASLN
jgi:hypothetical protein